MILKQLTLKNYKNISDRNFEFSPNINFFVGLNGSGKTNILDSIYYLCFGKSYFSRKELYNIKHKEDFFFIKGEFILEENSIDIIEVLLEKEKGKCIKRNSKKYKKISEHLGSFLAIMISPSDIDLINEGGSERRKFIDSTISLYDKKYLNSLINYNKLLQQRNSLLKLFFENNYFDEFQLDIYNKKMSDYGNYISEKRKRFIVKFIPIFQENYNVISDKKEEVIINFKTSLENDNLYSLLKESQSTDMKLQITTKGIHKDDFDFKINDFPIKKYGSQGQQKSFLISLKNC